MADITLLPHLLVGLVGAWAAVYAGGAQILGAPLAGRIYRGSRRRRAVALTFDDGPEPIYTPRILEILARGGAHATFFVVGQRAERHPEIVRAIVQAGHEVGNHTQHHRPLWLLPPAQTRAEIDRCDRVVATLTGRPPRYFRPPWGQFNLAACSHLVRSGTVPVLWSLRPEGWLPRAQPEAMLQYVTHQIHPGAIINLHDGGGLQGTPRRTAAVLPALLKLLQDHGYTCLTLSELLREDGEEMFPLFSLNGLWERYEQAWGMYHHLEPVDGTTLLRLGTDIYRGPSIRLRDGTLITGGNEVAELHLKRGRIVQLHRIKPGRALGFAFRREMEVGLTALAALLTNHARYAGLQAVWGNTLFWQEAMHLGFEVRPLDSVWRARVLGWYQHLLLRRDHPLGRRRLQNSGRQPQRIWMSRQALLQRYGPV